jgi:hypothetical protein
VTPMVLIPLLLTAAVWGTVRALTWPLPEWVSRGFWVVVIVLGAGPMFVSDPLHSMAGTMVLAMCAGAAGAEAIALNLHQRWVKIKAQQEAARLAAKEQERAARRKQRRSAQDEET